MAIVSKKKLKLVEVLLEGSGPSEDGWWAMYCPYHGDSRRSAGLNVDDGRFVCHGCNERKTIDEVIADKPNWKIKVPGVKVDGSPSVEIGEATIDGWHSSLLSNRKRLNALMTKRGLNIKTIQKYELGWDTTQSAYTIPIRAQDGEIVNVRFYQLDVPEDRRKIWSVTGMGTPTLWPLDQLDYVSLVVCEGEMDALLTIQNGIPAITRTGAADVWGSGWSQRFAGKIVYVCHDMDAKGQIANRKISMSLRRHALRTIVLKLPYEITDNHGKDLTDYWQEGNTRPDFIKLAKEASDDQSEKEGAKAQDEIFGVNVMQSFDASLVGKPLQMKVTVVGKRTPSYVIPERIEYECDLGAPDSKCAMCTMNMAETPGSMVQVLDAQDPVILRLIKTGEDDMSKVLQKHAGIVKCPRWVSVVTAHRTVEEAYVRASIEDGPAHTEQDFTHRRIISTVSHDLESNQSVVLTGTIRPHPKSQENEFQAWGVAKPPTGLDLFKPSPQLVEQMREFQSGDPLAKMTEIAEDQAVHYTQIFNRSDLHIFSDLVFHSLITVPFRTSTDTKGWLDCIVIGDTRTGKSAIAKALIELYNAGEMVSCEAATFAGVVGGLDHMPDGSWIVKWGSVPVFDRRVVVLDEVSGLKPQEFSAMSDMRSSGLAKLTKIKSEQAMARTRLLWLGNSRDGKPLASNTYAVDALKKLVGNNEDIARFDMAMAVFSGDVASGEINKFRSNGKASRFTVDGYRGVLQWAWTRTGADVKWDSGVEQLVLDKATEIGGLYIDDPPLVQGANMRMKIARTAAAMAARTYSTVNGKHLQIAGVHVEAAVEFINGLYSNPGFGYRLISSRVLRDAVDVHRNMDEIKKFLATKDNLVRMIKMDPSVSFMQLKTICGSDDEVRMIMNNMWNMKAAKMSALGMTVESAVLAEVREFQGE